MKSELQVESFLQKLKKLRTSSKIEWSNEFIEELAKEVSSFNLSRNYKKNSSIDLRLFEEMSLSFSHFYSLPC